MIIFDLEHLEDLPGKIKNVLGDEEKRCRMAESGREKTRREHTWDKRAEQFLKLLDQPVISSSFDSAAKTVSIWDSWV